MAVQEVEEVLKQFGVDRSRGLDVDEAVWRLKKYGLNKLVESGTGWMSILVRQLKSPFVYLLMVAAVVSWFLGEVVDVMMMVLFIVINTSLGFYQEYKSEQIVRLLGRHLAILVRVRRGVK